MYSASYCFSNVNQTPNLFFHAAWHFFKFKQTPLCIQKILFQNTLVLITFIQRLFHFFRLLTENKNRWIFYPNTKDCSDIWYHRNIYHRSSWNTVTLIRRFRLFSHTFKVVIFIRWLFHFLWSLLKKNRLLSNH